MVVATINLCCSDKYLMIKIVKAYEEETGWAGKSGWCASWAEQANSAR